MVFLLLFEYHFRFRLTVRPLVMVLLCKGAQRSYTLAKQALTGDGEQTEREWRG
ncbi:hypothetical protein [Vibrio cortegadensis]|uniref:Uncharacterized protein n=1 Tax=Vibrio cortegadensis TaxID=1328770 RepID=A0ABV4MC43_9VIBR